MPADVSALETYAEKLQRAANDFKPFAQHVLEQAGEDFLDIVQKEIEAAQNVDARLLLSSFTRGGADNVWELNAGGLTLTIGTRVKYAAYVNDGHRQTPGRFVPGVWSGDRFQYIPGAKTGMVLKASFVPGSHYFDKACDAMTDLFGETCRMEFDRFFQEHFG